jgi:hypothetical protein
MGTSENAPRPPTTAAELTAADIEQLPDLPTRKSFSNNHEACMPSFLEFIEQQHPDKLSPNAKRWIQSRSTRS